ncbi:UDP-N-acetylmuramoyl-tripeptide--D-alanyl-D-alanine ligase [Shouchella shacheensis]|uniref:UDP-N-acetylmuramoyl-tripeptide--D-alanyl-D- alanine ligase n=1 Tax=Shouchella shacheensis TaxID=1649580 RepID=UPI00073FE483|nr:UDP-N-acetylmuramoyl-tripeptide--D-alanyl-D-alanine ligase [Shouchella shacheensis]
MTIHSSLLTHIASSTRLADDARSYPSVSTDTRTLAANALFVPLVGERFDGHTFLQKAVEAGATGAIWQSDTPVPADLRNDVQLYFVEDSLVALQELAHAYRKQVDPFVIGITGSNGKTTTKDMLEGLLLGSGVVHKTKGNLNNQIGVPLTLLSMPADCTYAVIEMGMNHFGEIERLSEIARPNAAIVTSIGDAHLEFLGSRAGIAKAKMEIEKGLIGEKTLYLDGDEPLLAPYVKTSMRTVGFDARSDVHIEDVTPTSNGYSFLISQLGAFSLPILGRHNVKNVTYCLALASSLGIASEVLRERMNNLRITEMRLQQTDGPEGSMIVNDAYNANPTSMKAAVDTVKEIPGYSKKVAVLGDIYELGSEEEALHASVAEVISSPITTLLAVGEKGRWIFEAARTLAPKNVTLEYAATVSEAKQKLKPYFASDTVILLKASRGLALEGVLPSEKGDE